MSVIIGFLPHDTPRAGASCGTDPMITAEVRAGGGEARLRG
jgi:hypothetical protein